MFSTYYDILGISQGASSDEIRRAFRKKAKQYHPDVNKSADANAHFLLIKKAYEVLISGNTSASHYNTQANHMSSFESYMSWKQKQEEQLKYEARLRYEEFIKRREKFRTSKWYYPSLVFVYLAAIFCYLFAAFVIGICAYFIHKTHFLFIILMLPFISGAIFLIKSTGIWFKETKRYF